jgi:hypothetical protein
VTTRFTAATTSRPPAKPGVTHEEIGEIVANLALNILTNYFNVLAQVENDWPVVAL